MDILKPNFQIQAPPEKAMAWNNYERLIQAEWEQLLKRTPPPKEPEIQTFFENHPSMVPGAFGLLGISGHYPWHAGLIAQPPLPSYENRRVPDFMWLSNNSAEEHPVLIELEAPAKRWFKKSGDQTADFSQALNQITDWKAWFSIPHNMQAFKSFYGLEKEAHLKKVFKPVYLLIYGRRSEANENPNLTQKRPFLHGDDIICMTYDRLKPNSMFHPFCCIKINSQRRIKVVSVPATIELGPWFATERAMYEGMDTAIETNSHISQKRKDFLINRFPYWDKLAQEGIKGIMGPGDVE